MTRCGPARPPRQLHDRDGGGVAGQHAVRAGRPLDSSRKSAVLVGSSSTIASITRSRSARSRELGGGPDPAQRRVPVGRRASLPAAHRPLQRGGDPWPGRPRPAPPSPRGPRRRSRCGRRPPRCPQPMIPDPTTPTFPPMVLLVVRRRAGVLRRPSVRGPAGAWVLPGRSASRFPLDRNRGRRHRRRTTMLLGDAAALLRRAADEQEERA